MASDLTTFGDDDTITVVVTGPARSLVGGQTQHIRILEAIAGRLGYRLVHVEIGRRSGETGRLSKLRRLLGDYLAFTRTLIRYRAADPARCIVHLNSSVQFASMLRELGFLACARAARCPVTLVQFHGSLLEHPDDGRWLLRAMARIVAAAADRLVVLSRHQAAAIGGRAAAGALVAPNVVEARPLSPQAPSQFGIDPAETRLLYVGRLSEEKGVSLCATCIARLRSPRVPLRLTIAGDGEFGAALPSMIDELGIGDAVTLLGAVPAGQVRELLLSHDLLLFPSLTPEGLPYVLIEAMEAGLPVVATITSESMAELVDNSRGGIVGVRPTVDDFVAAVARLVGDPQARRTMGREGREAALQHYSLEAALARWREAWQPPRRSVGTAPADSS